MQRNKNLTASLETKNHLHKNVEDNNESITTSDISETNAKNDITRDFDLRKAIIYSEILKPKFYEE